MTLTCSTCSQTLDSKDFDRSGWMVIPTVGHSDPIFICPKCQEVKPDGMPPR